MERKKTIFRRANKIKWVTVDKGFIEDKSLSLKAKGMLLYLLSLPDDWKVFLDELADHHKDGRDSVKSAIRELKDKHYVVFNRPTDKNGKFIEGVYLVYELPQTDFPPVGKP